MKGIPTEIYSQRSIWKQSYKTDHEPQKFSFFSSQQSQIFTFQVYTLKSLITRARRLQSPYPVVYSALLLKHPNPKDDQ